MKKIPSTFRIVANGYYHENSTDDQSAEMSLEVQRHIGSELFHFRILRATGWNSSGPPAYENAITLTGEATEALRIWLGEVVKWHEYVQSEEFSLDDVDDGGE